MNPDETNVVKAINWFNQYHRLTNYISAASLYLKDNFFLEEPLKQEHIKNRILGHWGTVPGLNFIYAGLNYLVKTRSTNMMLVVGPGHGAPAVLSNLLFEGSLGEFYPEYTIDKEGASKLIKNFSWPLGFPSHTYPGIPGTIHEGGELGYSLGIAYGAALDNPDLVVACVVGDGEAETGGVAASWHSNKFLNPEKDGAVLPILHLNGYKISGPTILGTMSKKEINHYFLGLGYEPIWVDQYESINVYIDYLEALITSYNKIIQIKSGWNTYEVDKPAWPLLIVKTKKGWGGPKAKGSEKIEDNNLSHGIPLRNPKKDAKEFELLKEWLESYKVNELFEEGSTKLLDELLEFVPRDEKRIGMNKHTFGGDMMKGLKLPKLEDYSAKVYERGVISESAMLNINQYFRDVIAGNEEEKNFRIFSPDESESNLLKPIFVESARQYIWPVKKWDEYIAEEGRIMEILSENVLMEWMQGYNMTGRHGVLISYESFLTIITSQIDQYIKFLKKSQRHSWRKPLPSLNFISTGTAWRQEHNGYSHQNPVLINALLETQSDFVSIYFPADVNTLLVSMKDSLKRTNAVNLIISGKRDLPQWLRLNEATEHVEKGLSVWHWVGNERVVGLSEVDQPSKIDDKSDASQLKTQREVRPDVVLASAGDYQTLETIAAASILKKMIPELKFRYVNVNELTRLGLGDEKDPAMSEAEVEAAFSLDRKVIFNFHGYPEVIKQLTWGHELATRLKVLGYIEEGTTTTPFDMQVQNQTSRYHVCMEAIKAASHANKTVSDAEADLLYYFERKLAEHKEYILKHGDDMPEIKEWRWE